MKEKTKRNEKIVRLRDEKGLTFAKLGQKFGISSQRAEQIYKSSK